MTDKETAFEELLRRFSKIPVEENEPPFLELCHFSGERFEEICSRILEFFFQPKNKHGFQDLWFSSLCSLTGCGCDDAFDMKTRTEESTFEADINNKRIDIILETPSWIIAIENKIGASLYNPLDTYKEHVEKRYPNLKKLFVVLTARPMSGDELQKAETYGFKVLRYDQLFKEVKARLGYYVMKGSQKYLVFMLDFMKTVERRVNMMEQTDMDKFFVNHREEVEQLISQYNEWRERVAVQQRIAISDLKAKIQSKTNDWWWDYQGLDLGKSFNDNTPYRIGIESEFKENKNNPIGEFRIYITTWNLNCWAPYKEEVLKRYPLNTEGFQLDEGEYNNYNRMYYHVPVIERKHFSDDASYMDEILNRLDEYYQFLKELSLRIPNQ